MPTETPLDDLEFLCRSDHRVTLLETLASGGRTRAELHEATGISQPTLGRILGDFEERGWVDRRGQEVSLTPFGAVLAEQFGEILGTLETMRRFREVAPYLPLEEFPFDPRAFQHATVTLPEPADPLAHVRRVEEVIVGAEGVRLLSPSMHPQLLGEVAERLTERAQSHEAILHADALDAALADPSVAALVGRVVGADGARVYRYDGPIPVAMLVADDVALLIPADEFGVPRGVVETTHERIRSWVTETLDEYRSRATELTVEDLDG